MHFSSRWDCIRRRLSWFEIRVSWFEIRVLFWYGKVAWGGTDLRLFSSKIVFNCSSIVEENSIVRIKRQPLLLGLSISINIYILSWDGKVTDHTLFSSKLVLAKEISFVPPFPPPPSVCSWASESRSSPTCYYLYKDVMADKNKCRYKKAKGTRHAQSKPVSNCLAAFHLVSYQPPPAFSFLDLPPVVVELQGSSLATKLLSW